jgi:hypothetical protein
MKTSLRVCALAAAAATILPATAIAAPVTVTLRIEGPDSTLYEGPVTTDIREFHFTGDPTSYQCDGTAANGGPSASATPTGGAAVTAAIDGGLVATGKWYTGLGPSFQAISRVPVSESVPPYRYMVEFYNGKSTDYGLCAQPVADGDEVLLAFAEYGTTDLLRLNIAATKLAPGATTTATVTSAADGKPVAGATVAGRTTGPDGTVVVGPYTATGPQDVLKATKAGWVRSNGGQVCVTDGADGACGTVKPLAATTNAPTNTATGCKSFGDDGRCGTPDSMPPLVRLTNLSSKVYAAAEAPRELKGQAGNFRNGTEFIADPSGIKDVKLRITRYVGRKCWGFDGAAERFTRLSSCGTGKGKFFSVGNKAEWSYLLPAALKPGKYRVEAYAVDGKGNADKVRRWNRNHVVFRVK